MDYDFSTSFPVKSFPVKWDIQNHKKVIRKRLITRLRKDNFCDFDNQTDTLYEDRVNMSNNIPKNRLFKYKHHEPLHSNHIVLLGNKGWVHHHTNCNCSIIRYIESD